LMEFQSSCDVYQTRLQLFYLHQGHRFPALHFQEVCGTHLCHNRRKAVTAEWRESVWIASTKVLQTVLVPRTPALDDICSGI
jgi:hypothetical protein